MRVAIYTAHQRGFTLIEVMLALSVLGVLYALFSANLNTRTHGANFAASMVQARLWADTAEVDRQRGVLQPGVSTAPTTASPRGGTLRRCPSICRLRCMSAVSLLRTVKAGLCILRRVSLCRRHRCATK